MKCPEAPSALTSARCSEECISYRETSGPLSPRTETVQRNHVNGPWVPTMVSELNLAKDYKETNGRSLHTASNLFSLNTTLQHKHALSNSADCRIGKSTVRWHRVALRGCLKRGQVRRNVP
jgi:hypothetical protein